MKQLLTTLLLFWSINIFAQQTYDIVIVGGTPGGLTTALAAAKLGKTSVILERTQSALQWTGSNGYCNPGSNNRIIQRVHLPHQRLLQKKIWCNFYTISEM